MSGWIGAGVGAYGWYIDRWIGRWLVGHALWGTSMERMFDVMVGPAVPERPATVLDVPCGTGVALDRLPAGSGAVIALDSAPQMLERVVRREHRRHVRPVLGDALALPIADGTIDLCVSLNGLHCYGDPGLAVEEIARCLRTGGIVVGTMIARGQLRRSDIAIELFQRRGIFGPGGTVDDLAGWFGQVRLQIVERTVKGALVGFTARKVAP